MNQWPLASVFQDALQNPSVCFRDPTMHQVKLKLNAWGIPEPNSGAFAAVFKGTLPKGNDVAIRIFTSGNEQRRERYDAISSYLAGKSLKCLVKFTYDEKGIRLDNYNAKKDNAYPLITMEWVKGEELFKWVQKTAEIGKDNAAFLRLSEKWVELIAELESAKIAHGDLQHANVMVTPQGELKLVDYDSMCVPSLEGCVNTEIGVEPYQHPQRNGSTKLFLGIDNFSALYILVVLRALAENPGRFATYNYEPNSELYDKLLFRADDFAHPSSSRIYKDLTTSADQDLVRLTKRLFEAAAGDLASVPRLSELIDPFMRLNELLAAKDFDSAVEEADRQIQLKRTIPPALSGEVQKARERVKCRQQLNAIYVQPTHSLDTERRMAAAYDAKLLADYPAAKEVADYVAKSQAICPVLSEVENLLGKSDIAGALRKWDANKALLMGRRSCRALQTTLDAWRDRNRKWEDLKVAKSQVPYSVDAVEAAISLLENAGGHPDFDRQRDAIDLENRRYRALSILQDLSGDLTTQNDRELVAAWDPVLLDSWNIAGAEKQRVQDATRRLAALASLELKINTNSGIPNRSVDEQIVSSAAAFPMDYADEFAKAVEQCRQRVEVWREFETATSQIPRRESVLAAAWRRLREVNAQSFVTSPQLRSECERATQILPAIQRVLTIHPTLPPEERDPLLKEAWDDSLLKSCNETKLWRPLWLDAVNRLNLLSTLKVAVQQRKTRDVYRISRDKLLQGYRLPAEIANAVAEAGQLRQNIQRITDLLSDPTEENEAEFRKIFNADELKQHHDELKPYWTILKRWVANGLLSHAVMGMRRTGRSGLTRIGQPSSSRNTSSNLTFRAEWGWPDERFSRHCVLQICRKVPADTVTPSIATAISPVATFPISRESWSKGGGYQQIVGRKEFEAGHVVVWAKVDLGEEVFYSPPLYLGKIDLGETH